MTMIALIVTVIGVRASSGDRPLPQKPAPASVDPSQPFSKDWKMDDLLPVVADLGTGRDWNVRDASCSRRRRVVHATRSDRSRRAPASRRISRRSARQYSRDFILQSILEPSATVNGRFFQTTFTLKNGDVITGSVIDIVDKKIIVAPVMLAPQVTVEIARSATSSREAAVTDVARCRRDC